MSLFLTSEERAAIERLRNEEPLARYYSALRERALRRSKHPGLVGPDTTCTWWFCTAEYLTDAALAWTLEPDETLAAWLRDVTLDIARKPESDWVGPSFRDHRTKPSLGHLETAHLGWGVAVVLDLAGDIFSEAEQQELSDVLAHRAIPLCLEWFKTNRHLANWRCIMTAGVAVPAAVLDDRANMQRAVQEYRLSTEIFQPDGSYAESVQYANYASIGLTMSYEALVRRDPSLAAQLPMETYARTVRWWAASHLYNKPLPGWGTVPRARSVNFNDAAAIFRPSGEVLLHIATRAAKSAPNEAALARWMFDEVYTPNANEGPWDLATFGLVNHFGFLTLPLLPRSVAPRKPAEVGLPLLATFSNGDVLARDCWPAQTVLGVRTGSGPLNGPGHLHGDLNHCVLIHRRERLLADSGHSCYRNLIHELEGSTLTHNTCTFAPESKDGRPLRHEEQMLPGMLQQERRLMRRLQGDRPEPPVERGARRLLAVQEGPLVVIGSEAAKLYGPPMEEFSRFWLMLGSNVLFIVDRVRASLPVKTTWNWMLNNRDGQLKVEPEEKRLVARRNDAGLAMYHFGEGLLSGPLYAYVHDAYHTEPAQRSEGRPGSGWLYRWQQPRADRESLMVHAIVLDSAEQIGAWRVARIGDRYEVTDPSGKPAAWLTTSAPNAWSIGGPQQDQQWSVAETADGQWACKKA